MAGRKKLKLTFITNENARKTTFTKRKKGLLKKLDELTTLCDVEGCAIIYGPYEPDPIVGPDPLKAHHAIARFKSMPLLDRTRKMLNHEEYLKDQIAKVNSQIQRVKTDNIEAEMMLTVNDCLNGRRAVGSLTRSETIDVRRLIERTITELDRKLQEVHIGLEGTGLGEVPRKQAGAMVGGTVVRGGDEA